MSNINKADFSRGLHTVRTTIEGAGALATRALSPQCKEKVVADFNVRDDLFEVGNVGGVPVPKSQIFSEFVFKPSDYRGRDGFRYTAVILCGAEPDAAIEYYLERRGKFVGSVLLTHEGPFSLPT